MKLVVALLLLLLEGSAAQSQNGTIVERRTASLPDTTIDRLRVREPAIREILGSAEILAVTYLSDGLRVKGYVARPRKPGRYPCVIYNRGGNRDFSAWTDARAARILGKIASWGYVVAASQYRGSAGGDGAEEFGGRDVDDVLNLVPLLERDPSADTSRIGIYGWSRGGMMTYLALARSCRFRAAVVGSGMTDLIESRTARKDMDSVFAELIPGYASARDSVLRMRSAVYWPERLCKTTPLLLLQGSADWRVSPARLLDFSAKLYEVRHPFRLMFFEGGDHALADFQAEVDAAARAFLDRYVRDRRPWPSMEPHGN